MASRDFLTDIKLTNEGVLVLEDSGSNTVSVSAPTTITSSYSLVLPVATPADGEVLEWDTATSAFIWSTPAGGSSTLDGLTDVIITGTPADNEILAYDNGSGDWINQTAIEAGLAALSHSHSTGDITSGTLGILRGGTGASALPFGISEYTPSSGDVSGHLSGIDTALGLRYESGDTILAADGTIAAPGFAFASDTNNGIYYSGQDTIVFVAGGKAAIECTLPNLAINPDVNIGTLANFEVTTTSSCKFIGAKISAENSSSSTGGTLELLEATNNGSSAIRLRSPNSLSSNQVWLMPPDSVEDGVWKSNASGTLICEKVDYSELTGTVTTDNISDITVTSASDNDFLVYVGGSVDSWINTPLTESHISDFGTYYKESDTILLADGTELLPSHSFVNDTSSGLWRGTHTGILGAQQTTALSHDGEALFFGQTISGVFSSAEVSADIVSFTGTAQWSVFAAKAAIINTSDALAGLMVFREAQDNGSAEIGLEAPVNVTANTYWTLPEGIVDTGVWKSDGSGILTCEQVDYSELTGTAPGGSDVKFDLNQASPTLAVMDAVYHDGSDWQKAQADDPDTLGTHIVVSKATDDYELAQAGRVTVTAHGLTVGEYYFVSDITAGLLTSTEPSDNYSNPLVYIEDANTVHVLPYRPTFYTEAIVVPYLKSIGLESPGASEDVTMFFTDDAITVTQMNAVLKGTSTPSVTWTIRHNSDRNATGAEVVTSGTTTTSTTTGSEVTSFNDETIPAGSWVWLETTAQSGSVDEINITIEFTRD